MKLYDYYRSTACYRVRIALHLKKLDFSVIPIHLTDHGGEQHQAAYKALNPAGLVPTLDDNGHILQQSLAIIEYLDEIYKKPPLLPENPVDRAKVRSLALLVACDMHPLNNLRVLTYLRENCLANDSQISQWYHHWLKTGFDAFEAHLGMKPEPSLTCQGNTVSLADICLIPQVYNAHRFGFDMQAYPLIRAINEYCQSLEAFKKAAP